jgi:hypothetical protein
MTTVKHLVFLHSQTPIKCSDYFTNKTDQHVCNKTPEINQNLHEMDALCRRQKCLFSAVFQL